MRPMANCDCCESYFSPSWDWISSSFCRCSALKLPIMSKGMLTDLKHSSALGGSSDVTNAVSSVFVTVNLMPLMNNERMRRKIRGSKFRFLAKYATIVLPPKTNPVSFYNASTASACVEYEAQPCPRDEPSGCVAKTKCDIGIWLVMILK